jgi:hypothetical protein
MLQELREAQRILQDADRVLTERTMKIFAAAGVSSDAVQREYDRLTQLAESGITEDPD